MREYEFRGRSEIFGCWIFGNLVVANDGTFCICNSQEMEMDGHHIRQVADSPLFVDPETVGQYTGLEDKNGKKIYKGDILHVIEWENILMFEWSDQPDRYDLFTLDEIKGEKRKEYTSAVFWDEGGFCIGSSPEDMDVPLCCLFGDMKRSSPIFEFEIVGNIYDNPELLRQNESE